MERKIGEIFEFGGEWYQCVKGDMYDYCKGCPSFEELRCTTLYGNTDCWLKATCEKLEKVGEPFSCNYYGDSRLVMMQEYQLFDSNVIYWYQTPPMYITDYKHKRIAIEIKQNKEDMEEEREYSGEEFKNNPRFQHHKPIEQVINMKKMKPFDLQKTKAGKPVCTRDGRKARIICFDAKGDKPLIILSEIDGKEVILRYTEKGQSDNFHSPTPREDDLMMLPEKKEGWVNICRDAKDDDRIVLGSISESREEAVELAPNNDRYTTIATVRIEWEE